MTMKKYGILVIIGTAFVVALFYKTTCNNQSSTAAGGVKVALVVPAVHPSMDAIVHGFIVQLNELMPDVHVEVYNANGNKTLLHGQVTKIVRDSSYAMCAAVGTNASTMLATALARVEKTTPLIGIAVSEEVSQRLKEIYGYVTGVIDCPDKQKQIDLLLHLKNVKNPLLVYDPASNPSFEKDKREYEALLNARGVKLDVLPVYSVQEVYQKLSGAIKAHDAVITLTDHTLCSAMDAVIKLSDIHGVTLYTSELDSNDKGAALSFGVQERDYGLVAGRLAARLYKERVIPSFKKNGPFYLKINRAASQKQKVNVPQESMILGVEVLYGEKQ